MKKIIIILLFYTSIFSYAKEYYYYIDYNQLPQMSIDFLNKYFSNVNILYIEPKKKGYELKLANGVEIEFFRNGELKEVEGNYIALPFEILPKEVSNTVMKTYPNSIIRKIKRKWNLYEVKLNNMMELYIDMNGQLLGQDFDD